MVSKKKSNFYCAFVLLLSLFACVTSGFAESLTIRKTDKNNVLLVFKQPWAFDMVKLPTVWPEVWGNGVRCNAAVIEISGQHFVAAATGSAYLEFILPSPTDFIIKVSPIDFSSTSILYDNAKLEISAVTAHIRSLESRLDKQIDNVLQFNRQNNCFSCHTSFPLAIACNEAFHRGYKINRQKIQQLAQSIIDVQKPNGTFYFPLHPDYGIVSTSLCAGAILASLSDCVPEAISGMKQVFRNLPNLLDNEGIPKTDFYFRPIFIGQMTSALFESLIISTIYRNFPSDPENEQLRQRLLRMQRWAKSMHEEPVHRKIILMTGLPYLVQFDPTERDSVVAQLENLITYEPEGKRSDIRAIARMILQKISPRNYRPEDFTGKAATGADQIWQCLEQIVSFSPHKANKIIKPVDMAEYNNE